MVGADEKDDSNLITESQTVLLQFLYYQLRFCSLINTPTPPTNGFISCRQFNMQEFVLHTITFSIEADNWQRN
jgi:hypothetical protein